MSDLEQSSDERITSEAAAWFARIREEELSGAGHKQFARWLAESPVHVREYLGVADAWGTLKAADCWPEQTRDELFAAIRAMQPADVVPLKQESSNRAQESQGSRPRVWDSVSRFALAAALGIVAVAAAWVWWSQASNDYRTARGEQRSVVLEDGSVVQLNTLTKIVVRFDDSHRRIQLPQGEAFFRVAHDARRPFEVVTPFARVRAVGTEFNVYNRPEGTRVAVVEGRVQVAASADPAPKPLALAASQAVDVGAKGKIQALAHSRNGKPGAESAIAWIQRRIVLDDTPLDAAVAEFNRYNKLQMQIADERLGELRITGVFSADDPLALAKYLDRIQEVEVLREGDELTMRRNP